MNVGRMDLVVIQYCRVRFRSPDKNACKIPVLDSNSYLGVRSLVIVGQARSAIVLAGAYQAEESGQRCGGVRKSSALAPEYQGDKL